MCIRDRYRIIAHGGARFTGTSSVMHHFSERIFFNEGNNFKRGLRRKDLYIYSSSCFVIMVGILMVLLNKMYAYPILCVRVHVLTATRILY